MLKPTLLSNNKESNAEKSHVLDKIMTEKENIVFRPPPCHSDINAIEMIWGIFKNYVAQQNISNNMNDKIAVYKKKFKSND